MSEPLSAAELERMLREAPIGSSARTHDIRALVAEVRRLQEEARLRQATAYELAGDHEELCERLDTLQAELAEARRFKQALRPLWEADKILAQLIDEEQPPEPYWTPLLELHRLVSQLLVEFEMQPE